MNSNFKFLSKGQLLQNGYETTLPILNKVFPLTLDYQEQKDILDDILMVHKDHHNTEGWIYFDEKTQHIFDTMYERCNNTVGNRYEFRLIELYLLKDLFEDVRTRYIGTEQEDDYNSILIEGRYENTIICWTTLYEEVWDWDTQDIIDTYM